MEDWKINRIQDLSKTTSGGTPSRKNKEYYCGDILWVKSGELEDNYIIDTEEKITQEAVKNSSAKLFPKGTILMAMYGATVGKTAILKKEATTNQAICGIIPNNDNFNSEFLRYQLIFKREDFLKQRYGGAQPNISQTIIKNFEVAIPPLPEQHKIAHILNTVQKAIEQQDKLIRTTTELKKALMQKLFTEGTRGEPQKETEIGLVPESWDAVSIEHTKTLMQYGTSVKCDYENEGVPVIRIPNIISGKIDLSDLKFGKLKTSELEKLKLNKSDLIFVRTNGAMELSGRCAIFQNEIENCYYASYLIRLQLDNDKVIPDFLNYYTQTELGKSFLSGKAIRTADGKYNINTGILNDVLFPLPTLDEQKEIIKTVLLIEHKIALQNKKKQTLTALFKTLLHELMTGHRRVHELEFEKMEEFQ